METPLSQAIGSAINITDWKDYDTEALLALAMGMRSDPETRHKVLTLASDIKRTLFNEQKGLIVPPININATGTVE